jgi:uncharacterized protein YbcC (UPF0753/DUF2309 family)
MSHAAAPCPGEPNPVQPAAEWSDLRAILTRAARYLPAQGPISSFVALNPLHGFEDRPFLESVEEAARLMDSQPYLEESAYREALASGRILPADIDAVLAADLGRREASPLAGGRVRLVDVQRLLLMKGLRHESDTAVRWTLTESNATERLRTDLDPSCRNRLLADASSHESVRAAERRAASELWHACVEATAGGRATVIHRRPPARPRDLIVALRPDLDPDSLVHPPLIRLLSAYLDQGVADWGMPDRSRGLLAAVADTASRFGPEEPWASGLRPRLREIADRCEARPGCDDVALEVIDEELRALAVSDRERHEVVTRSLIALRGWAGMVWQLEQRPDLAPCVRLPARLADFLAVRLVFDRIAATWTAGRLVTGNGSGASRPDLAVVWAELRDRFPPLRGPGTVSRAFLLHQLSQLLGLTAADIRCLEPAEILALEQAIYAFDQFTRRRLLHLAYERRFNTTILDALAALPPPAAPGAQPVRMRSQVVFCIDDRCESLRRHLEETDPAIETFGAAGFFSVPMNYRGIDDWHATPLCPIVVRPDHTVTEIPEADDLEQHEARQRQRRLLGRLREQLLTGSRTLFLGGLLTSVGGAIAAVPLVSRVVFPRLTTLLTQRFAGLGRERIRTRLALYRTEQPAGAERLPDGTLAGFTIDEMAGIVRRLLEDIGLTESFARLVALLGHGATTLNNPHESAYDCGACGGGRGGPNARAFALMANDPAVRSRLATDGLAIPADTIFVGGMQDTCSSSIEWYELDRLPASHHDDFTALRRACDAARALEAQERCRRFDSVPLGVDPHEALQAVQARAGDLAQVRPEYGHATTALCIVGRRSRTRSLFLDRRAFLMSYDPDTDPDDAILSRTLAAVGPVCSGISLAYTFSRIDPLVYGAGTKLPHNITGLIGVMDGHCSDLRTGLPLQGVEIHEPVRLLLIVETTPDRLRRALAPLPAVERLVRNGWVHVACWPPDQRLPQVYDAAHDRFVDHGVELTVLPVVGQSADWYGRSRDNRRPAVLRTWSRQMAAGSPPDGFSTQGANA